MGHIKIAVIKDITLSIGTLRVNDYLFIKFLMYFFFLLLMKQILSYMSISPFERLLCPGAQTGH